MSAEFIAFPKIDRFVNETVTITEKIDGTNACITVDPVGCITGVQSRKRMIAPGKDTDNYGFAGWVLDNERELVDLLGPGRHYGEWWGIGVNGNRYNLDHKRFSLFNTHEFPNDREVVEVGGVPVRGVPVVTITQLPHLSDAVEEAYRTLTEDGSLAAPGCMNPEGVMLFLHRLGRYLKNPFDAAPKGGALDQDGNHLPKAA